MAFNGTYISILGNKCKVGFGTVYNRNILNPCFDFDLAKPWMFAKDI